MHLLIADDHRGVAEGIGALLAGHFEQISYAFTPEEAEAALAEATFDLILLDLDFQRPDRNGFDLLVLARQLHPAVPSLILTQFGDPSLVSRAAMLGAAGFVHKDAGATVLRSAVTAVLAGGQAFPDTLPPAPPFTQKQIQVMSLLSSGLDRKEIARRMHVSTPMIDTHLEAIQRKLGVHGLRATAAEIERRALHLLAP